jgi:hypothetical protein
MGIDNPESIAPAVVFGGQQCHIGQGFSGRLTGQLGRRVEGGIWKQAGHGSSVVVVAGGAGRVVNAPVLCTDPDSVACSPGGECVEITWRSGTTHAMVLDPTR